MRPARRWLRGMIAPAAVLVVASLLVGIPALRPLPEGTPDVDDVLKGYELERLGWALENDRSTAIPWLGVVGRPGMRFHFKIPEPLAKALDAARSYREDVMSGWKDVHASIGDGPFFGARVKVRGMSSARFMRKSLIVDLGTAQSFTPEVRVEKLFLLNLVFDPHGFEMRSAIELLRGLGLYPGWCEFARVTINGESRGLYLAVERPRDAVRRAVPDSVSVMRLGDEGLDIKWQERGADTQALLKDFLAAHEIEDSSRQARRLDELLDVKAFLTWMAFNSLVENADSGDELFLYEVRDGRGRRRFGVMGWDYDDMQRAPAHPDYVHEHPLTYAATTPLEYVVIHNPLLIARYRRVLRRLLEERLTEPLLRRRLAEVRGTLAGIDPENHAQRSRAMREFEIRLLRRRAELLRRLEQ